MPEIGSSSDDSGTPDKSDRKPLPQGYRQGIITAITVLLGFSLAFLRFWGTEAPGQWTIKSIIPGVLLTTAVVLQIVALYRALRLADDEESQYQTTVRWFIVSAAILLFGLASVAWELA